MDWVGSTLHTTSEHGVSSITTADAHNSVTSSEIIPTRCNNCVYSSQWLYCYQYSTELTPPADLNGLVLFDKRRNLASAHVPSHFKHSLQQKRDTIHICREEGGVGDKEELCSSLDQISSESDKLFTVEHHSRHSARSDTR